MIITRLLAIPIPLSVYSWFHVIPFEIRHKSIRKMLGWCMTIPSYRPYKCENCECKNLDYGLSDSPESKKRLSLMDSTIQSHSETQKVWDGVGEVVDPPLPTVLYGQPKSKSNVGLSWFGFDFWGLRTRTQACQFFMIVLSCFILSSSGPGPRSGPGQVPGQVQVRSQVRSKRSKD